MTQWSKNIIAFYHFLMQLYPKSFRGEFQDEMEDVFALYVQDAVDQGGNSLPILCFRELWDLPGNLIREYVHLLLKRETSMDTRKNDFVPTECPRCGYQCSLEARYCANCGRRLISRREMLVDIGLRLFSEPKRLAILILGVLGVVGVITDYLFVEVLNLPSTVIFMFAGIGIGCALIGWKLPRVATKHERIKLAGFVLVGSVLFFGATLLIEKTTMAFLVSSGKSTILNIPGMFIEVIGNAPNQLVIKRHIINDFPYIVLIPVYIFLVTWGGNLVSQSIKSQTGKPKID
jgi:hypothetical protein